MKETILKLCKPQISLPIFSKLLLSTLLLGLLSGTSVSVYAQATNQDTRVKENQAKQYIMDMNRAQQAFYAENGKFASTIQQLGMEISDKNYFYGILPQRPNNQQVLMKDGTSSPTLTIDTSVLMVAKPYTATLKMYTSGVFVTEIKGKITTVAGVCETIKPVPLPGMPKALNDGSGKIACPNGYQLLKN